ncbi:hypothetical protein CHELA40_12470 [Chelatococcus asaccharovorans]|nr:hypothetical protein CHELA40_12470 [Chelatococcus asaccharovorans]
MDLFEGTGHLRPLRTLHRDRRRGRRSACARSLAHCQRRDQAALQYAPHAVQDSDADRRHQRRDHTGSRGHHRVGHTRRRRSRQDASGMALARRHRGSRRRRHRHDPPPGRGGVTGRDGRVFIKQNNGGPTDDKDILIVAGRRRGLPRSDPGRDPGRAGQRPERPGDADHDRLHHDAIHARRLYRRGHPRRLPACPEGRHARRRAGQARDRG